MKPRLTSAVRRGLRQLLSLVVADVEASDSDEAPRWTKKQRDEIGRALEYLRAISYPPTKDEP